MMRSQHCIALIDCNAFYASCESVFELRLWTNPLVVLSNNDGTVVALNGPAKDLGVQKFEPFFKCRHLMQSGSLAARSSNYTLYGDMSARVMTTLRQFSLVVEVYSIDEAFLCLKHILPQRRNEYALQIRATALQHTGIPISIGIAETKTLAKVANKFAKNSIEFNGVLDITEVLDRQQELLSILSVQDVWGIGSRWSKMLISEGIETALKFRDLPNWWVRSRMGIVGLRVVFELKAGVTLTKLVDENIIRLSLFDDYNPKNERPKQLMQMIDELNQHFSQGTMRYAAMGTSRRWQTRAQYRSNCWTTRWDEIPIVKA